MVTTRDVARMAGVSQATVSRVLHDHDHITEETRQRVQAALAESGYRPNLAARAMRTRRTGTIGLVVDDVTNPFYPEFIQVIGRDLGRVGLRMVLWESAGPGEQAAIEAIDQALIDGLIFTTATARSEPLKEAIRRGWPVVLANRTVDGLGCDQVEGDNYAQAAQVARYLAGAGHSIVGLVGGPRLASTARDRMAGFRDGCRTYDLSLARLHVANGHFTYAGGRAATASILDAPTAAPTALFCANDFCALGALDEALARNVAVPDELWIVGYDDIAMARWETLSLTTVHQPLQEMAAAAVRLLIERISYSGPPFVHQRFGGHLIPRRSTAYTTVEP